MVPRSDNSARPISASVLLAELVDATAGVDDLLLARVERVAAGADFDLQVMTQRGAGNEAVTAAADHVDLFVFGMDAVFHGAVSGGGPGGKKGAQCSDAGLASQEKNFRVRGADWIRRYLTAVIHKDCG